MTRIFAALLLLLVIGLAAAQPPLDYTLMCDDEIIGAVSYVDDGYHVTLLAGVTCEGELSIAEDESLVVKLERDGDGIVTVTIDDEAYVAEEVPQQALDGVLTAHANRAVAGHGQETATAMQDLHKPELPERPELPELPERPEPPVEPELPDLPEAAGDRRR